jgi:hypothetical protein
MINPEFLKMQKLAGLITESQYNDKINELDEAEVTDPEAEKNAEEGLKAALSSLKSIKVGPSPKDKELKEIEPVSLTVGLLASAPGLMRGLGSVVNFISKPFLQDKQKGTVVGNALKHWGHDLEDAYLRTIANLLQSAFPQTYGSMEYDENNDLGKASKKIYMGILVAAGVHAGLSAATAHSLIAKGIEGGMYVVKSAEAAELATALAKSV